MKKSHLINNTGITLVELLVSSILVGIIMVGIVSFNFAMKRLEDTSSSDSILNTKAAAFLSMIKKDAERATGDFTNVGIITREVGDDNVICFRHDVALSPDDYTDDDWVCYSQGAPGIIARHDTVTGGIPCDDPDDCIANDASTMKDLVEISSAGFFNVPAALDYISIAFTAIRKSGEASDPLRNPTINMSTRINPTAHGRN